MLGFYAFSWPVLLLSLVNIARTQRCSLNFIDKLMQRSFVYNISWEDPRIDRRLYKINEKDTILMITSVRFAVSSLLCSEFACCIVGWLPGS